MQYWTDAYLGRPWIQGRHTCMHLVLEVQREQFGRQLDWPVAAPSRMPEAQWRGLAARYAAPVQAADAIAGDVAHLTPMGHRAGHHLGVLCVLPDDERHILHCAHGLGTCLHREMDMTAFGFELRGYYRPLVAPDRGDINGMAG